jgi:hypothetical protein
MPLFYHDRAPTPSVCPVHRDRQTGYCFTHVARLDMVVGLLLPVPITSQRKHTGEHMAAPCHQTSCEHTAGPASLAYDHHRRAPTPYGHPL